MFKKQMCLFLILAAVFTALFCLGYYGQFFPGHISEHETLIAGQSLNSQDVSSFDESDLVRNYRLNVDNDHDVLVFLHMQKTGGTTFGRHLVKDLNVTHPCVCYRRRKRCDCQNANNRNWLFSRYSTGWSCGLHADWTELNDCVDSMLNRMERKQRLRRYFYVTMLRDPIQRYLSEWKQVQRGGTWLSTKLKCNGRQATLAEVPFCFKDLTGSQDGCVRLWEWGHAESISEPRKPGAFPKATKVLFNSQGNKFGVSDTEGAVCLWQVGLGLSMNKPYLSLKCHSKVTNDFVFVGSSSLLATSGQSTDNRNVCLWDTLLPKRKALVQAFHCHNDGCPALAYAPQHQVIISGGRKGEVFIFDVRQRQLRQTFQAHDSAIKCMAIDSTEECFVTGSADGDVKVWGLAVHNLMYAFTGEHSKGSSLFRNASSGVTQVYLSPLGHLFSCGTDGSLKVHQMAHKRGIVNTWNA